MENVNSCCYIARIDEIKEIPGADNIEQGVIVGLRYKKITGTGGKEKNLAAISSGFVIDIETENIVNNINNTYKKAEKSLVVTK